MAMVMVMAVLHGGAAEEVSKGSVAAAAGGAAFSDCKMFYAMIKEIHDVALQFDSGSIREEAAELVRAFESVARLTTTCSVEPGACIATARRDGTETAARCTTMAERKALLERGTMEKGLSCVQAKNFAKSLRNALASFSDGTPGMDGAQERLAAYESFACSNHINLTSSLKRGRRLATCNIPQQGRVTIQSKCSLEGTVWINQGFRLSLEGVGHSAIIDGSRPGEHTMLAVNGELKMSNIMFENVNRPTVQSQPLKIKPTGNATFRNCTFKNHVIWHGLLLLEQGSKATFQDCRFLNIRSENTGFALVIGQAFFQRCTFARNTAKGSGGALYAQFSSAYVHFQDTSFIDNKASTGGGAVVHGRDSDFVYDNCLFRNNSADQRGRCSRYAKFWLCRLPLLQFHNLQCQCWIRAQYFRYEG